MPLLDHLRELRKRIMRSAIAILIFSTVGWFYYNDIIIQLSSPVCDLRAAQESGNEVYSSVGGSAQPAGMGLPSSCNNSASQNPGDLLPKDTNSQWAQLNPSGKGELANVNLLKAGYHIGIDTIGQTLRNANLQIRSEPPNPQLSVGPWNQSTIEPDFMRPPLELGSGAQ